MPREIAKKPRFIYPQVATSLSLAKISALAELLFWRILTQTDDQGRLSGEPVHIKAIACPIRDEFTTKNIPGLLKELADAELILCYSASSEPIIQIAKWWDYQSSMRRIFPSHYPSPQGWEDRVRGVSLGQTPTNAHKVRLEVEEEVEREPEPEPEREPEVVGTPTTAAATVTAIEAELLSFLETLEGWRFKELDDLRWVRDFTTDFSDFSLTLAKACRDYHSGLSSPKHKGIWKSRFRHWMEHERPHGKGRGRLPTAEELEKGWKE